MADNQIVHNLYLKYRKDKRVVRKVMHHPILFARNRIVDEEDWQPVRIRYFGAFVLKNKRV